MSNTVVYTSGPRRGGGVKGTLCTVLSCSDGVIGVVSTFLAFLSSRVVVSGVTGS